MEEAPAMGMVVGSIAVADADTGSVAVTTSLGSARCVVGRYSELEEESSRSDFG